MITVKWMLIWFTQLFDIEDTVHYGMLSSHAKAADGLNLWPR